MATGTRDMTSEYTRQSLPRTLPIFPLPGALLLPRGNLPLNIFEPRYVNMIADAVDGDRVIGMIQPKALPKSLPNSPLNSPAPRQITDSTEVYETGCAGRIASFSETDDGRYLITLTGVCRFRVARELARMRGYRRIAADYEAFATDLAPDTEPMADRPRLLEAVRAYFAFKGVDTDWQAIEDATDSALVTALAMVCPLESGEKQALLEAPTVFVQGTLLTGLLEMAIRAADSGTPSMTAH